jgi:hypothetical protein
MRDAKGNFLKGATMPKSTILNEIELKNFTKSFSLYESIVARNIKVALN